MTTIRTILTAIAACAILCATAQTYDLKLDLKKGLKYDQSMIMNMTMDEAIAGQQIKMDMTANFGYTQEVKSVEPNGDYVIESTYEHIAMKVSAMGSTITYDSDLKKQKDSIAESLGSTFSKVIGKKFLVTVSPKGKVSKVTGLKEILTDMMASSTPNAVQLVQTFFDEDKIISNYSSAYGYFPDHAVKVGETWNNTNQIQSVVPVDIKSTYTLKEVKGNNAVIGMAADIAMKNDSMEVQGMTAKLDLKGTFAGDYKMDIKTGLPTAGSIDMPITGSMEIMNMAVPMNMKSSMDMRCKIRP
ncbi:MAG: hypothetical protein JST90_02125 [Bacteroidetes bacterium]|nr:hypothetical protein [Bacteroidota bacterium]